MSESRRYEPFDAARAMQELASPIILDPEIDEDLSGPHPRPSLPHALLIFVGGFGGTLARYVLINSTAASSGGFPWQVFVINVSGSLVLGILASGVFSRRPHREGLRLFTTTGFLGGWTTYSAVIAESLALAHVGSHGWALGSLALQLLAPPVAAGMGILIGSGIRRSVVR